MDHTQAHLEADMEAGLNQETELQAEATESNVGVDTATETDETVIDLPDMSYDDLEKVKQAAIEKQREQRAKERAADVNTIKTLVVRHGLKWGDIKPAAGTRSANSTGKKVAAKYRDPETGAEWSGRGMSPLWIRDKNRDDFLIDKSESTEEA